MNRFVLVLVSLFLVLTIETGPTYRADVVEQLWGDKEGNG